MSGASSSLWAPKPHPRVVENDQTSAELVEMIGKQSAEYAHHRFWLLIGKAEQHHAGVAARRMSPKVVEPMS